MNVGPVGALAAGGATPTSPLALKVRTDPPDVMVTVRTRFADPRCHSIVSSTSRRMPLLSGLWPGQNYAPDPPMHFVTES